MLIWVQAYYSSSHPSKSPNDVAGNFHPIDRSIDRRTDSFDPSDFFFEDVTVNGCKTSLHLERCAMRSCHSNQMELAMRKSKRNLQSIAMKSQLLGIVTCIAASTAHAIGESSVVEENSIPRRNLVDTIHNYIPRSKVSDAVSRQIPQSTISQATNFSHFLFPRLLWIWTFLQSRRNWKTRMTRAGPMPYRYTVTVHLANRLLL